MCADAETENADLQVIEGERAPEPRAPSGKNGGEEGFSESLFELDPNPVRKGKEKHYPEEGCRQLLWKSNGENGQEAQIRCPSNFVYCYFIFLFLGQKRVYFSL